MLSGALLTTITITPTLRADEHARVFRDKERNEDHHWDAKEEKAYRMWLKENHRKYRDFAKTKEEDQRQYWAWRRDHSDAVLKIDVR